MTDSIPEVSAVVLSWNASRRSPRRSLAYANCVSWTGTLVGTMRHRRDDRVREP